VAVASDTPGSDVPQPVPAQTQEARREAGLTPLRRLLTMRELPIVMITILTLLVFVLKTSRIVNSSNIDQSLLPTFAPLAIVAAGEVFIMINGEIDLSVGGTYLFAPFVMYQLHNAGVPTLLALFLTLLVMLAIGVINGFFVAVIGISSFVTTLGTLLALEGLTLVTSGSVSQITPAGTTILGNSTFEKVFGGGTYSELIWAVGIVVVLQIGLSFTRWGLHTVAVGGNRLGASEAGISARRNMIRNFAVCALMAGFAGILVATQTTADPSGANGFLFQAISAAVIGGTLLTGGSGTVAGALIGALFLGLLQDGLVLIGTSANREILYQGLAIIIAMTINTYVKRFRTGAGHG
jgi:simple sugar transport system permease protein